MSSPIQEFEVLLSGYLDGELDSAQRRRLEELVDENPALRQEYEAMTVLVRGTSAALHDDGPTDEIWDKFLDGVYNRAERAAGWVLSVVGCCALAVYGIVMFLLELNVSLLVKILLAAPVTGIAVLFASVLRQRLNALKTDRYAREVHR